MPAFPIFLEVGGRPPLVIGKGELALAKVRTLLLRAPLVDVVASGVLAPGFVDLIRDARVVVLDRPASDDEIRGRPLVISATGDDAVDAVNFESARAVGVPINVPDRPHLSTFSLPAIVDRAPVTVAIGTEGAAPVLATRLRGEIEQQLHPKYGRLAVIARAFRAAVADAIPPGAARRAFWQDVFGGPAADAVLDGDEAAARRLIEARLTSSSPSTRPGKVILVGAGPGDPELLTLKAVRALKSADVVVHDGLMGDGVLDYARREAQFISVAKAKGRHSRTQAEINALLVGVATQGKIVVRLKGGDPTIFGRGGEEIDTLRASGVIVEVIPGVTAATAVAASLQIPLTHRDISQSVTFISGHAAGDGQPSFDQIDFAAMAAHPATLAVYMGLATAPVLSRRLIASGWSRQTPVIAVACVSQAGERRIATTLEQLADPDRKLDLESPALLIVGEVASLDAAGLVERFATASPPPAGKEQQNA